MNRKKIIGIVASAMILVGAGSGFAHMKTKQERLQEALHEQAKTISDMQKMIDIKDADIEAKAKDIETMQAHILEVGKAKADAEVEVIRVQSELTNMTNERNALQNNLSAARKEIQALQAKKAEPVSSQVSGEVVQTLQVRATAYTAYCTGCEGLTKTGFDLRANPHAKVIAVDPSVVPLGSKVWVEGYGYATALDTGGAIKGNRIDVYIPDESKVYQWGVKHVTMKVLK